MTHQAAFPTEEWTKYDDAPHLFVNLDTNPVVLTIRGIRHFGPFFKRLGYPLAGSYTPEQFRAIATEASCLEFEDLAIAIGQRAIADHQPSPYKVLHAIISGSMADIAREQARLDHRSQSQLRAV